MRMRDQFLYSAFRVNYLYTLWEDEVAEYMVELYTSNDPEHQYMASRMDNLDEKEVKKLLKAYVNRCTFKHSFTYL